jgi:hypothetical protein
VCPIRHEPQTALLIDHLEEKVMRTQYTIAIAMLAGFGLGAVAVQGLHAQAKPPVYLITEIDVTNIDAYTKEYAPKAQAIIKANGGRLLAAGQKVTALEGDLPGYVGTNHPVSNVRMTSDSKA